ncbi:monovalent cation:proton antiporter, putative [Ricinus communis]|uniref:Monovalent cation:proton antiporter, putative n=2 Tax=Ricinus communis TaxID=3988 RepID=B9SBR2_RICCO|nr:monovalent cation:proton antiporter, putative [Ricinus communis]
MEIASNQKIMCTKLPPNINSNGIWENINSPNSVLTYSLPLLQLQIIMIFFITQACHFVLKHFGFPIIISQLIAGVILGPSLLGSSTEFKDMLFTIDSQDILGTVATLGYTLFMFVCGVKMDVSMIFKTGGKATAIGFLSLAAPLVFGLTVEVLLERSWLAEDLPSNLYVITSVLSATPFPVISTLLSDLKILNSELGRLGLSAAMIGEIGTVGLFTLATLITVGKESSVQMAFRSLICIIGFIAFSIFAIRPAMFWIIKQTPKGRPVKDMYIHVIIFMVFGTAILSNSYGQSIFFGPFILGLAIPDGPPLGSAIVHKLDCMVSGIFVPLFVTTSTMRAEFGTLRLNKNLITAEIILIIVTLTAKLGACLIASLYCQMPLNDSLALALVMSCKGIVELATYSFLRDNKIVSSETFTLLIVSVLVTATIVPMLVKKLYDPCRKYAGYQKRNILNLRYNSELRILVCIHSPDDITAAINVLDASCPNPEKPLSVSVLHLMKLIGRASPIFISHNIQIKSVSKHSYSDNVITSFNQYQQKNIGAVSISTFTAISPPKLMHEDICTLALDKLASLIILPFHINWSSAGSIVSEDTTIRALNHNILERAPCSIGILVNRGHLRRTKAEQSPKRVAMIFLGGNDDREALTFAKRMAIGSSAITIMVINLVANDQKDITTWEQMLDSETLKDVKHNTGGSRYVTFKEVVVKDGTQTACILRGMACQYDLIIVGRRNGINCPRTTGLAEWSEFPELGVVGDLLASSDVNCKASILVMQQQQQQLS